MYERIVSTIFQTTILQVENPVHPQLFETKRPKCVHNFPNDLRIFYDSPNETKGLEISVG